MMAATKQKNYFGKKLTPQETEEVVAALREMMLGLVGRWRFQEGLYSI